MRRRRFLQCETTGTHWRHLTDRSCDTRKERFCPQAYQKSHACVRPWHRIGLAGLTILAEHSSHTQQVDTQATLQNYRQTPGDCSVSQSCLTSWNSRSSSEELATCILSFWFQALDLFSFAKKSAKSRKQTLAASLAWSCSSRIFITLM